MILYCVYTIGYYRLVLYSYYAVNKLLWKLSRSGMKHSWHCVLQSFVISSGKEKKTKQENTGSNLSLDKRTKNEIRSTQRDHKANEWMGI